MIKRPSVQNRMKRSSSLKYPSKFTHNENVQSHKWTRKTIFIKWPKLKMGSLNMGSQYGEWPKNETVSANSRWSTSTWDNRLVAFVREIDGFFPDRGEKNVSFMINGDFRCTLLCAPSIWICGRNCSVSNGRWMVQRCRNDAWPLESFTHYLRHVLVSLASNMSLSYTKMIFILYGFSNCSVL